MTGKNKPTKGRPAKVWIINWRQQLNLNKDVKAEPFDPAKHRMIKVDSRTYKQVEK